MIKGVLVGFLWGIFLMHYKVEPDMLFLTMAIIIAGGMAGDK